MQNNYNAMNQDIKIKFESYPTNARENLYQIRDLIFSVAQEYDLGIVTEQLKWGEPSYSSKFGSPIRIDWKSSKENQISLYVNCKTLLIETFKEIYGTTFQYEGKREIVLPLDKPLPIIELRNCLFMALQYHKLKKLPLLGS